MSLGYAHVATTAKRTATTDEAATVRTATASAGGAQDHGGSTESAEMISAEHRPRKPQRADLTVGWGCLNGHKASQVAVIYAVLSESGHRSANRDKEW